jgi:hypothetical protein
VRDASSDSWKLFEADIPKAWKRKYPEQDTPALGWFSLSGEVKLEQAGRVACCVNGLKAVYTALDSRSKNFRHAYISTIAMNFS